MGQATEADDLRCSPWSHGSYSHSNAGDKHELIQEVALFETIKKASQWKWQTT